jgi:DNA-binding CsgD family transcriptional regulator
VLNLTPRENEIACLVREARGNASIASGLGISKGTVDTHLRHIYRKLQLHRFEVPRVALAVHHSNN